MIPIIRGWFTKKLIPSKSILEKAAEEYKCFEPSRLRNIFSSDMSIVQISVCKSTIEDYQKFLKVLINAFDQETQLTKMQVTHEISTIYFRDFFVDRKQFTVEPVSAMEEFIPLCARFLELYHIDEINLDPSFIVQSNLRHTKDVVNNLVSIMDTLKTL